MRFPAGISKAIQLIALIALIPLSASSQTDPPGSRELRQLETVQTWPNKAKRWALVIGVDKYADTQITTLGGSSNDAKALADALVRYAGFPADQVTLLSSDQPAERHPTRGNILRRLSNLATVVPPDGLLLVSFAGHGMERSNQAFLLPSDAQVSNDIELLEETAINVTQMKDRIRRTGVGQVVLILDACRNDPVGRANDDNRMTAAYTRAFNFDVRNREVTAFATLYATAVGHRAYEFKEKQQGYFTWELIEGIKGGAANERGEVTLEALIKYVQERVPKHVLADLGPGKEQKPFAETGGYRADQLVISVVQRVGTATDATTPGTVVTNPPPVVSKVDPAAIELAYWETIKNSTDPADFQSYLEKYPDGQFADLARRRAVPKTTVEKPRDPPVEDRPPTTQPNTLNLYLANVYIIGLNLGMAELGAFQNASSTQLIQPLTYARDAASMSGVPSDSIGGILNTLRTGVASQSQYQSLVSTRQSLEAFFSRNCNCGSGPVNLYSMFVLGGQFGFMEVVAYQNGDRNYLMQIMTSARQLAAGLELPTGEFDEIQRQLRSGKQTNEMYQRIAALRLQIVQSTGRSCSCVRYEVLPLE